MVRFGGVAARIASRSTYPTLANVLARQPRPLAMVLHAIANAGRRERPCRRRCCDSHLNSRVSDDTRIHQALAALDTYDRNDGLVPPIDDSKRRDVLELAKPRRLKLRHHPATVREHGQLSDTVDDLQHHPRSPPAGPLEMRTSRGCRASRRAPTARNRCGSVPRSFQTEGTHDLVKRHHPSGLNICKTCHHRSDEIALLLGRFVFIQPLQHRYAAPVTREQRPAELSSNRRTDLAGGLLSCRPGARSNPLRNSTAGLVQHQTSSSSDILLC